MCRKVKLTHVNSKAFLIRIGLMWLTIKEHIGKVDLIKLYFEVISQRYLDRHILQIVVTLASVFCRQAERLYSSSLLQSLRMGSMCSLPCRGNAPSLS